MGSVTYDWSPLFQAVQGLGQRMMYQKAIDAMTGAQTGAAQLPKDPGMSEGMQIPTPPMTVNPGMIGGTQLPAQNIPSQPAPQPAPQMATPQAQSNPYASMLPMLKYMDPSMGMPLLMQLQMKQAERQQNIQDRALKPMDPTKAKSLGFKPGDVVYEDISGNPVVAEKSDMMSPGAAAQQVQLHQQEGVMTPEELAQKKQLYQMQQAPSWAELAEKKREFNASNPMLMGTAGGPAVTGPDALSALPSGVKATVQSMLDGRMSPPSSMAIKTPYWQQMLNLANQVDPTFDQTAWSARVAARKDMMGGGKTYQLLNSGNTAIQHLGRLYDQIPSVAGHQIPVIGNLVNSGENALAAASGIPGVDAYNDTLGHLSEETTKFYRSTGGSEADIERNMGNLAANKSTAVKQAGVANTVHLLFGSLQPKVEQFNKAMGTNYPVSHFLSQTSIQTLKKMGYDPDSGEPLQQQPGGAGWSIKLVQ